MIWTDRSVIFKPISKKAELTQRSSCITSAKPKSKGISLSKDISSKSNKSVQFIKLTQRGVNKNIQRREIKLLIKMKGEQPEGREDISNFNMFGFDERRRQDYENLSFTMNTAHQKQPYLKYNKNVTANIANEVKQAKQPKNYTKNSFINLHLHNNRVPIARIL